MQWYSKKQSTVEISVVGTEFVAMKQGIGAPRGLRYKIRKMSIPISGPSFINWDKISVLHNMFRQESMLKKSSSVCYHAFLESVAMDESLLGYIASSENTVDL